MLDWLIVSYNATVLNAMIASPGDVSKERMIVRDVINEWNAIHARDRGIVLMPVGWETHSTPDTGDRPQAIINRQLLKDADLLVAVFWTRLGSPTGVAASGTVEEIEEHLKAEKSALIYFSSEPVRPDSIDNEQYEALKKFKESLRLRGLYSDYDGLTDFRSQFSRHLAQRIIEKFPAKNGTEPVITIATRTLIPTLSSSAGELLSEASRDPQGSVMSLLMVDGASVDTNGVNFVEGGDARSAAKWRGAVEELNRLGLIEDRGGKGEVFFVTDKGYEVAGKLPTQGVDAKKIPLETVRVVPSKKHSHWGMGSNHRKEPLMFVNFHGSITDVSGTAVRIVSAELVGHQSTDEVITICNGHNGVRPQTLSPYEMADLSIMFIIPPMAGLEVGSTWKASMILVDQFNNRHPVPDCSFQSHPFASKA